MNRSTLSLLLAATLLLPAGFATAEEESPPATALFAPDSDELDEQAKAALAAFAAGYEGFEATDGVIISGHGDVAEVAQYGESGMSYCIGLAQRRAANVRSYLVERGIPDGDMTTQSFGCSRPAEEGGAGAANRRVEVETGDLSW